MTNKEILKIVLMVIEFIWTVVSFLYNKNKELSWKKTEFILLQSQILDNDKDLIEMVKILENRHQKFTVNQLFSDTIGSNDDEKKEYQQKFDKLLNFLWRFCYAYTDLKTLGKNELTSIGWYLRCISNNQPLLYYCQTNGYRRIIKVIKDLNLM